MTQLNEQEKTLLANLAELAFCNPFLPRRIELERQILGDANETWPVVWNYPNEESSFFANAQRISQIVQPIGEKLKLALAEGATFSSEELQQYENVVLYCLFDRYREPLTNLVQEVSQNKKSTACPKIWDRFLVDYQAFVECHPRPELLTFLADPAHLWSCMFQIRRLFHYVFHWVIGSSEAAARLRASIWQSVLTHQMRRYFVTTWRQLGDVSTLITGPSGTGKELVARAIAMSQYIPFDTQKKAFLCDYASSWLAIHLAAKSPTLIESELFGHCKGAYTGAMEDRKGVFESCGPSGAVFLDEIGELNTEIQVKLLRVLQTRTLQRLGELTERHFTGKVIAATNRNLALEMQQGTFREDLYYRLCGDRIETPALAEQLASCPDDLKVLVSFLVQKRNHGEPDDALVEDIVSWIQQHLGPHYPWPGNVRELEQCISNLMIRGRYEPLRPSSRSVRRELADAFLQGDLTTELLLEQYVTMVYAQTGSYEEASRRLKIDRRTVKSKVNSDLLERLNQRDWGEAPE